MADLCDKLLTVLARAPCGSEWLQANGGRDPHGYALLIHNLPVRPRRDKRYACPKTLCADYPPVQ